MCCAIFFRFNRTYLLLVKSARNIPCHTKVKHIATENDENQNITVAKVENGVANAAIKDSVEPVALQCIEAVPRIVPTEIDMSDKTTTIMIEDKTQQRLQDFELHRKLMEEQNKMKRNLLQQAISKYTEKTQADAKKLDEIRLALNYLDADLATDVKILRKQIESASLHFNAVEKNYIAVEKSFLKAKQDLYQAHEKKEMLTEHLYTIIAHNEDRKAKKLSELMEKVGLSLDENGT